MLVELIRVKECSEQGIFDDDCSKIPSIVMEMFSLYKFKMDEYLFLNY